MTAVSCTRACCRIILNLVVQRQNVTLNSALKTRFKMTTMSRTRACCRIILNLVVQRQNLLCFNPKRAGLFEILVRPGGGGHFLKDAQDLKEENQRATGRHPYARRGGGIMPPPGLIRVKDPLNMNTMSGTRASIRCTSYNKIDR